MKIAIGCDHIVTNTKNEVRDYLRTQGHEVIDCGTFDFERTHYPIYGKKVAEEVVFHGADCGIVMCGTGVGITNAVNKVKGARCALVGDVATAKYAKEKLNANVIGFGARVSGIGLIIDVIEGYLSTKFEDTKENNEIVKLIDSLIDEGNQNMDEKFFDEFLERWENGEYKD